VPIVILLFTEIGIGLLNVFLLAPVGLQVLHLLVADTIWIWLVLASSSLVLEPHSSCSGPCSRAIAQKGQPAREMSPSRAFRHF